MRKTVPLLTKFGQTTRATVFPALGMLTIIFGFCGSLWLGLWVMFVGGLGDIINVAQISPVDGMRVARDVFSIIFAPITVVLGFVISFVVGLFLMALGET